MPQNRLIFAHYTFNGDRFHESIFYFGSKEDWDWFIDLFEMTTSWWVHRTPRSITLVNTDTGEMYRYQFLNLLGWSPRARLSQQIMKIR